MPLYSSTFCRPLVRGGTIICRRTQGAHSSSSLVFTPPQGTNKSSSSVFLLGWAGAQPVHLQKYATNIYAKNGIPTVSYIGVPYSPIIPDSSYGREIAQVLTEPGPWNGYENSSLTLHVFSMNGTRTLISLIKYLKESGRMKEFERIEKIIFDSCPAHTLAGPDSKAYMLSVTEGKVDEFERNRLRIAYGARNLVLNSLSLLYPPLLNNTSIYYYVKENVPLPQKQLYLYSEADNMVRSNLIADFAAHQKRKGKEVTVKDWKKTAHVSRYRMFPEEYENMVLDFIKQ